ncbi:NAD(P)-binding Rossmann-fold containing protein [Glarea lozoyensis ATCC 20868]|uniref:NAD(P)-binding Rossmann-fold containing protein n=1 Tax=Glarea lozoyensis (strain ATCC 20868 / MF5171) TaxID=1116229 RepID=S3DPC0_GLAL2|nr:NAD(P)-binding Rossmann-fold containing protein [Glarea lozoyensis ATCC 20868]EPE33946.1 NAD(P)-binding Rossmann-fold containing protein [Glarea lozoyensis ATCC 20868]
MAIQSRIAIVTGGNKGIGLAIVKNLALQYPSSPLRSGPLTIYLTARSAERGNAAVETLLSDPALQKAKVLSRDGGDSEIKFRELDISSEESIKKFGEFVEKEHSDGIDVVVNNAGIALDGFNLDVVKQTLHTNYHGTLLVSQTLLPLIRPGGRLVNIASMAGHLSKYSKDIQKSFLSAADTSIDACTALMDKFTADVAAGKEKEEGWTSAAYAASKAGEIAFSKVLAREWEGKGVLVNACCPGYVKTDMTKGNGAKSVDEGARTPVMLALAELNGKAGGFWQSEKEIKW